MRVAIAFIGLAVGSMRWAGPSHARTPNRLHARSITRVSEQKTPAHRMSALALEQRRERQAREARRAQLADWRGGDRSEVKLGAFGRDYSLNVSRPAIRPDQDGAVGFSFRMKTHE